MKKLYEYNNKKDMFLSKSEELEKILKEYSIDSIQLKYIQKKLRENQFSIIVVGEFSSGKSTFINSLLRQKILPSKVLPTTAIITVIEDGEGKAIVKYKNSKEKVLKLEEIKKFATALDEEGSAESEKVNYMTVKVENPYTKEGVTIIDTPGVEDLSKSREEITYNMIPKADAAIVILDSRRALKDSEIKFLKERILTTNINKIFYILNFADSIKKTVEISGQEMEKKRVLDNEELNKIIEVTTEKLKEVTGNQHIKIYALSSKEALNEYIESSKGKFTHMLKCFEDELQEFLIREKGEILLQNSMGRIDKVLDDVRRILDFKVETLNKPLNETKEKEEELVNLIIKIEEEAGVITGQLRDSFQGISKTMEPQVKNIVKTLIYKFKDDSNIQIDLQTDEYKKIINNMINTDVCNYFENDVKKQLEKCIIEAEKKVELLIKDLNEFLSYEDRKQIDIKYAENKELNVDFSQKSMEDTIKNGFITGTVPAIATLLFATTFHIGFIGALLIGGLVGSVCKKFGLNFFESNKKEKFDKVLQNNSDKISNTITKTIKNTITQASDEYSQAINKVLQSKINSTKEALKNLIKEKQKETDIQKENLKILAKENLKINRLENDFKNIVEEKIS